MALIDNDWVGYLDRSYDQIKASLLARVKLSNPELTDHSSSNIFVIIIEMFAGIAEMLGFYLDNVGQETYLATAQRRSSIIRHTRALDYRVLARNPERVDLQIIWSIPAPSTFTLAAGLTILSDEGIPYILLEDQQVLIGATSSLIPITQVVTVDQAAYAVTDGTLNQKISLGSTYADSTLQVFISLIEYTEQKTWAYSSATDKHLIVEVEEDGNAYMIFGDGLRGYIPPNALNIRAVFKTTLGPDGKVGAGKFDDTTLVLNSALPGLLVISSANSLLGSSGGTYYEDSERIRKNAIAGIRTLDRMVTRKDHQDIIESVPGVAKAGVDFDCGKSIDIYIVPDGGGIASGGLIAAAQTIADEKKMVTSFPVIKAAGETMLVIKATVTARKRKSLIETKDQVEAALVEFGEIDNQDINGAIRLSDLQALIDNQINVDFVDLTALYTLPYARPLAHVHVLVWTNETRVASVAIADWRLEYDGVNIRVLINGLFIANAPIGSAYVAPDNSFTFTVSAGTYSPGDTWEFKVYPFLKNLELEDFTIFRILIGDLSITVNPAPSI
jgi:hypothetical protein